MFFACIGKILDVHNLVLQKKILAGIIFFVGYLFLKEFVFEGLDVTVISAGKIVYRAGACIVFIGKFGNFLVNAVLIAGCQGNHPRAVTFIF